MNFILIDSESSKQKKIGGIKVGLQDIQEDRGKDNINEDPGYSGDGSTN
jgi:hypothetical protein